MRIWHGMSLYAVLRLMEGNWHLVTRDKYALVASILLFGLGNSALKGASRLIYGRRIDATDIVPDPIFILGHWRSGTTWLNHLMARDPRLASPTGGEVFMPDTHLILRFGIRPLIDRLTRGKRPMDNVAMSMRTPEEDEIALVNSGVPSPFQYIAFPNADLPRGGVYVCDLAPRDRARWRDTWLRFLRSVQLVNPGRRLLLKSPAHTVRLPEILAVFPQAKFIHIARDPYDILMSSQRANDALSATQALTSGPFDHSDMWRRRLERFAEFHAVHHAQVALIPAGQLTRITYEDLRADPLAVLRRIYSDLDLGAFDPLAEALAPELADMQAYRPNRHELSDAEEREIWHVCQDYFHRYGYARRDNRRASSL